MSEGTPDDVAATLVERDEIEVIGSKSVVCRETSCPGLVLHNRLRGGDLRNDRRVDCCRELQPGTEHIRLADALVQRLGKDPATRHLLHGARLIHSQLRPYVAKNDTSDWVRRATLSSSRSVTRCRAERTTMSSCQAPRFAATTRASIPPLTASSTMISRVCGGMPRRRAHSWSVG